MKVLGLAVGFIVLVASCQKEDLRPASNPAAPSALKMSTGGVTSQTSGVTSSREDNNGGGIVDPNADQDASNNKGLRKGGR
jgi:hypothetical protein